MLKLYSFLTKILFFVNVIQSSVFEVRKAGILQGVPVRDIGKVGVRGKKLWQYPAGRGEGFMHFIRQYIS
jgi:hypothetical protein